MDWLQNNAFDCILINDVMQSYNNITKLSLNFNSNFGWGKSYSFLEFVFSPTHPPDKQWHLQPDKQRHLPDKQWHLQPTHP